MLKGKKIIIGITGSISAYKIPYLVRLFIKEAAFVKVVMTQNAKQFVSPITLSTLSKNPVIIKHFNTEGEKYNNHIELAKWADLIIIAPASANTLSKMANGIADNILLTTYLAAKCPVYIAPAMNVNMLNHPTIQSNIKKLQSFGNIIIKSPEGELANGLIAEGRLEEPENIIEIIKKDLKRKGSFTGEKVMVTSGPTYENIDPVRFIGNYSSGLMGFSLAEELANRGAKVTLITGPGNIKIYNSSISRIDVLSAEQMYNACIENFPLSDIAIMSAAVADYTPEKTEKNKIKKKQSSINLKLKPTKDILAELGRNKRENQILIGFALETDNEIENARKKLKSKNLDFIVLNSLNDKGAGFKLKTNKITIIDKFDNVKSFSLKTKIEVARDIVDNIAELL